jgi:hypothetical protein
MVLFGGQAEPLGRLVKILWDTLAIHINFTEYVLSMGYPLLCERAAYHKGLAMVDAPIMRRHTLLDATLFDTRSRIGRSGQQARRENGGTNHGCEVLSRHGRRLPESTSLSAVMRTTQGQ